MNTQNVRSLKPQCETQEQLFLEAARVSKMCDGSRLRMKDCVKVDDSIRSWGAAFDASPECYEFALAIVEDKPVFRGDTLYNVISGQRGSVSKSSITGLYEQDFYMGKFQNLSWNPPKPKTVMIELLVEDAEWATGASRYRHQYAASRIGKKCQEALDKLEN